MPACADGAGPVSPAVPRSCRRSRTGSQTSDKHRPIRAAVIRMASRTVTPVNLTELLDALVHHVDGVLQAIVLSSDGLLVAASGGLARDDAEHLAAVASGLNGLARGAGRHLGHGTVLRTVIELDSGFLFVTAAGTGACLAVLAGTQIAVGLVASETERLVWQVE